MEKENPKEIDGNFWEEFLSDGKSSCLRETQCNVIISYL